MKLPFRSLVIAAAGLVIALCAGGAEARVHHHRHPAPAATPMVCGRHHRHCHAAEQPTTQQVCGRHHRHCHTVPAAGPGKVVCGRHHRHCHTLAAVSRRHASMAASETSAPTGDNGTCKSVRIHGEWVQRCHFPGEGQ